jgi:hypothetical protein
MSSERLSGAEKFVDIALAIADMDAASRIFQKLRGLPRLSSHRTLSFCSIGTRVGLIFRLSAVVPLNLSRVQNLAAVSPSGRPSVEKARLACIMMPQRL